MTIDSILEYFGNNPILNAIFLLLAIFSVILTFYFYFKSIRKKEPTFSIRSILLMKDQMKEIDSLEIKYQEKRIENLAISKVAFYNNGKKTIKKSDIAEADVLRLELSQNYQILDASVIFQKNPANNFNIHARDNNIEICFDYCDYGEGVVLQIVHTGESSEDIDLKGSIHGVKKIYEKSITKSLISRLIKPANSFMEKYVSHNRSQYLILCFLFLAPLPLLGLLVFPPNKSAKESSALVILIPVVFGIVLYWGLAITIIRTRLPKGFDIYNEEYLSEKKKST